MLKLEDTVRIPAHVMFSIVDEEAFLLNTRTNRYFLLDEVGARLWMLLKDGHTLKLAYQTMAQEYAVDPTQLERDLLELLEKLQDNGLVEIAQA